MAQPTQPTSQKKIKIILTVIIIIFALFFLISGYLEKKEPKTPEIQEQAISGYISQIQDNTITITSKHWDNEGNLAEEEKKVIVRPDTLFEVLIIDYDKDIVSKGPKLSFQDIKVGEGIEVVYTPKLNENGSASKDGILREATYVIIHTR